MTKFEAWKASLKVGKNPCWWCRKNGNDKSGNNFHYYGDGKGGHCYACTKTIPSGSHISEAQEDEEVYEFVGKEFNEEVLQQLKSITTVESKNFRGIRTDKTNGVRYEYDEETGQLVRQYYPCTINGELSGYKIREIPKAWPMPIGTTGGVCDPFLWFKFKNSVQKTVVIAAGELDALTIDQILRNYVDSKGNQDYGYYPVVSSTTGEGTVTQLQAKYEWFDRFEKIIICYDNDDAGKKATEKLAKVLPRDKVYVMDINLKDANCYLWDKEKSALVNKEKEFINCFFKARQYVPMGILGSDAIITQLQEKTQVEIVSLPSFLKDLEKMLSGGFRLKSIVNIVAGTSIGKTTVINAIVKHIIFNSPYLVGVVSLEADAAQYGESLLSEHIGRKLSLISDNEELQQLLLSDEVETAANELFKREDGKPRFYLIDDNGDYKNLQKKIEEMIIRLGVKIILLDPLSDALAGMSPDEQELFMAWQKQMKKRYGVLFLNIVHIRKASGNQKDAGRGAALDESAMFGSSSIAKSADVTIFLERDKYAEDPIIRNTTNIIVPKNRAGGITGAAGSIYYDNPTHKLWALQDWLDTQEMKF